MNVRTFVRHFSSTRSEVSRSVTGLVQRHFLPVAITTRYAPTGAAMNLVRTRLWTKKSPGPFFFLFSFLFKLFFIAPYPRGSLPENVITVRRTVTTTHRTSVPGTRSDGPQRVFRKKLISVDGAPPFVVAPRSGNETVFGRRRKYVETAPWLTIRTHFVTGRII